MEVTAVYRIHLGPRFIGAGLTVQFHSNQKPSICFKVEPLYAEYRESIIQGIAQGLNERFPGFLEKESLWITTIHDNGIDSSQNAFRRAGRLVVEQAFALKTNVL